MRRNIHQMVLYGLIALGFTMILTGSIMGGFLLPEEEPPTVSVVPPDGVNMGENAPTPSPTPTPVTFTKEEREAFFDDAVFVGDSITLKLRNYASAKGGLGEAAFLCSGNFGVNHGVKGSLKLSYGGKEWLMGDGLKETGKKKAFLMLGINDIALHGLDKTLENWAVLVGQLQEKNPDMVFYIQSISPMAKGSEKKSLTMPIINKYNERLQAFCEEKGLEYVDVASGLKDASGYLKKEYCSDEFIHLTDAGCVAWIEVLHQKANQLMGGTEVAD